MVRAASFEVFAVDLPFRRPFAHAAASRSSSSSLFLKCTTDNGVVGFGESLPRAYVTGESRDGAYASLRDRILPKLVGVEFASYDEVVTFLQDCDGKAPRGWLDSDVPQTAAWCAVDLALLDAFGRAFGQCVLSPGATTNAGAARYSGVLTGAPDARVAKSCLLFRLYGLKQVKMKVGLDGGLATVTRARRLLGERTDLRVDANMAWTVDQAATTMRQMSRLGVRCFEQPVAAGALDGMAQLVRQTNATVMADESFSDRDSLRRLIEKRACTAVNVRISKCGGLIASLQRCREARQAGLIIQIGCHVGESSLLSAAQLALLAQVPQVTYAEGCFGRHLLRGDPVEPTLRFGFAGRPPRRPPALGLGACVDEQRLRRWTVRNDRVVSG